MTFLFSIVSAFVFLLSFDHFPAMAQISTPGLMAAYGFGEGSGTTVSDASGNANTGVISGATWTTQGKFGNALSFNGASWVTINDANSLDLTTGMTLEAWVYPTATPTNWSTALLKEQSNGLAYALYTGSPANRPNVYILTSGEQGIAGNKALALNSWSHLAAIYNGTTLRLYVNGAQVASKAISGSIVNSAGPLRIGGNGVWGEYFRGRIDEVRIYNRELTQTEIQTDMNTAVGVAPPDGTPPTVSIISPTTSQTYSTSGSPLTLGGTAADDVAVAQVTWANNRGGSGTAVGTASWTASGIALQPGTNVLTVTGRDTAGNTGTATLTVTYDTSPPTVAITAPKAGTTVSGVVTVAADATDNVGVSGVQFLLDGGPLGPEDTTAPYSLSWDTATVPNGAHTVSARTRDAAGNIATAPDVSVTASNTQPPQPSGLVAAYSFNEGAGLTAADSSDNNNTGTLSGATWTTQGKYGNALSFNGISNLLTVNDANSLDLTTGMTLEAWVYPTVTPTNWSTAILKEQSGNLVYALYAGSPANRPNLYLFTSTEQGIAGPAALPLNTWSHLAGTYDGSTLRLYVNGTQVASKTVSGTIAPSGGPLRIGGNGVWGEYFAGIIDEARIYSRALAQAEIQNDMTTPIPSPPPPPPPPPPSEVGQWSGPFAWPFVAVHMALLHTGEVVAWTSHTDQNGAQLWNPTTGAFIPVTDNADNLFCAGHSHLPDGKLLVAGGHIGLDVGVRDVNVFDPATQRWSLAAPMSFARWYPTVTSLPDGRVLVTSGAINCATCIADIPEIYNPTTNNWTQLTQARLTLPLYPFMFVLPDRRVLSAGSSEASIMTRVLDVDTQAWATVDPVAVDGGSAAMYLTGKVIKSGTSADPDFPTGPSVANTYVLDMTQLSPAWRLIAPMAFPRVYHNLTLLPDGNVLVTGGSRETDTNYLAAAVYEAELWSPATETWATMASMQAPRLYHSTALLLPDARVLVAGGGRFNGPYAFDPNDQPSAEIYSPPYLFQGTRPTITSVPTAMQYGANFTVGTPDASGIATISLVRLGAVTHAFNQDQRILALTFQQIGGGLNVQAPANANLAPPGYYMLFIVDTNGVPSVASVLKIS